MRLSRVIFIAFAWFFSTSADAEAAGAMLQACLGAPVAACLAAMRPFLNPIEFQRAETQLENFETPDVAGHNPRRGQLSVVYHSALASPDAPGQVVSLEFGATRRTEAMRITLAPGTQYASTERDYARSRVFEAALFALGPRPDCPDMATPQDFYRFFHVRLRSRLVMVSEDAFARLPKMASRLAADTGWVVFCGGKIRYSVASAEWGWIGADMTRTHKMAIAALAFR